MIDPGTPGNWKIMRLWTVVLLLAIGTGCATNLSTLQTAKPIRRGQVEVQGAVGAYANLGPIVGLVGEAAHHAIKAKEAAENKEQYELTEEEIEAAATAAFGIAIFMPSTGYQVSARTGILKDDMDIGLRYSGNAVRVDSKYRFYHWGVETEDVPMHKRTSVDVAVGLGVSRFIFEHPAFKALEYIRLDDFSRWDIDATLYSSFDFGDIFKIYLTPKYLWSRTSLDPTLVNISRQASNIAETDLRIPSTVYMHFIGASGGIAAGYKYAHLYLELTSGYTICRPKVAGKERRLDGVTLYPAVGLALKFP